MRKRKPRGAPPAHRLVFDVLSQARRPVSAYEVLDRVRAAGISAPPTVYRALNRLIDEGLAHRLESLNAFVSCAHPAAGEAHRERAAFAICDACGAVEEFLGDEAFAALHLWAQARPFALRRAIIELSGRCAACEAKGNGAAPPPAPAAP